MKGSEINKEKFPGLPNPISKCIQNPDLNIDH